jgi:predicted nucleotidyltransferase component of viral defense system
LSVLDRALVEAVAGALATDEGLVEKDWHVVRALGIIAALSPGEMTPVFSGGTSLSKGWGLIRRFSEDIDFKVAASVPGRKPRSAYRARVLEALAAAGFTPVGEPLVGNESRFFSVSLDYGATFGTASGLRPHIRVEMTFRAPALPPVARPLRSLLAQAQGQPAEVPAFPCVDPVETAADKLSALAWRVRARQRGTVQDDPTIIRHLHDLAALEPQVRDAPAFHDLARAAAQADAGRGGGPAEEDPAELFAAMLDRLARDPLWAREYEDFVRQVSFAGPAETLGFEAALAACARLVEAVLRPSSPSN